MSTLTHTGKGHRVHVVFYSKWGVEEGYTFNIDLPASHSTDYILRHARREAREWARQDGLPVDRLRVEAHLLNRR